LVQQERLDGLRGAAERNRRGQFATPPALALDIAKYARSKRRNRPGTVRFLDPAIGSGSFYSAFRHAFSENAISAAIGIELDPDAAKVAASLWGETGLRVTLGDFTKADPPRGNERFDVVLTNPPYVRHHHLDRAEKRRLKTAVVRDLGIEVSGLAGLYCYFLLLCDRWLADNGLAVWLVPSEFMDVNYGVAVKRYLTEDVKLLHIHRFCPSDVQFADALVSSAVVVFEKSRVTRSHSVLFSFGGSLRRPTLKQSVRLSEIRAASKWSNYPNGQPHRSNETGTGVKFGDLFQIKRGLATGANRFFILPRDEATRRGIPGECARPILPSPRYLQQPVIDADSDGYPRVRPVLSLVDCRLAPDEIQSRFPALWDYLHDGEAEGIHERYLTSRRTPWYSQEKRLPAPFLCTYMGRAENGRQPFRFYWNKSQATAGNVYLLMYPRAALKRVLEEDPRQYAVVFSMLRELDTHRFIAAGRVYGGGLYKMEPLELGRLSAQPLLDAIASLESGRQLALFD